MDISRFTERARSILQAAQGLAAEHNHQFSTGSHLGLSLLDDESGLVARLLNIAQVDPAPVREALLADLLAFVRFFDRGGVDQSRRQRGRGRPAARCPRVSLLVDSCPNVKYVASSLSIFPSSSFVNHEPSSSVNRANVEIVKLIL